jgi:hypothetical protein
MKPVPNGPVVCSKVAATESGRLAAAKNEVHPLRFEPLDGGDPFAVERKLQDVRRLRMACELGVPYLVAPRSERRWNLDADEEIGEAAPPISDKHRLVNNVSSCDHRVSGGDSRGRPFWIAARVRYLDDVLALRSQLREVQLLVRFAFCSKQISLCISPHLEHTSIRGLDIEPRQVLAFKKTIEVAR